MTAGRQGGAALLLLMLVVLAAVSAILVGRLGTVNHGAAATARTADVLADAKTALLAFAAVQPDTLPGTPVRLPCPDIDGTGGTADGIAHAADCGTQGQNVLGRFPWRTLGTPLAKDASGACLWYAVSGDHKAADAAAAGLLNPDSAGRFQLYDAATGSLLEGAAPADRPVAVIFAPGEPRDGQPRTPAGEADCGGSWAAGGFLDAVPGLGIDNAALAAGSDLVDAFAVGLDAGGAVNDRISVIRQSDLARLTNERSDYAARRDALGLAVTACLARYGSGNAGGIDDRRLPWPAPPALADYRRDSDYDDGNFGSLSGRLPDRADDSSAATGNALATTLADCDPAVVPAWTAEMRREWQDWKDHFFYVVAPSYAPTATAPTVCTQCLSVNGGGDYAAVVLFAGPALAGQVRTAPPLDTDTKQSVGNYLEGRNAAAFPAGAMSIDLQSGPAASDFNDRLFCVDESLSVSIC